LPELSTHRWFIGFVFFVLFFTRILWWLFSPLNPNDFQDSAEYLVLAERILAGDWNMGLHRFVRPPGYPMIMAFFLWVGGGHWSSILLLAQGLASVATGCIIYFQVRPWLGEGAATGSVLVFALYPPLVYFNGLFCSEPFFLLFVTLAIWSFARFQNSQELKYLIYFGLSIAVASLIRTAILASMPVFVFWLLFSSKTFALGFYRTSIAVFFFLLVHAPFTINNYRIHGQMFLASNGGSFLFLNGNSEVAYLDTVRFRELSEREQYYVSNFSDYTEHFFGPSFPDTFAASESEKSKIYREIAFRWIRDNPSKWIETKVDNLIRLILPGISYAHWSLSQYLASFFFGGVLYLLAFGGFWAAIRAGKFLRRDSWYLLAAAFQAAALVIFLFTYRYKIYGLEVFYIPFAGLGASLLLEKSYRLLVSFNSLKRLQ
jgi:4-amino-4-deoxy-L-arabinose transferase-like glycosyltransferase